MIVVRDKQCGNIIDVVNDFDEGKKLIGLFEEKDKAEGIYEKDFYEVVMLEYDEELDNYYTVEME